MRLIVLSISLWVALLGTSDAHAQQRLLGLTAPVRNSVSNRVRLIPQAGMAIIYDMPTSDSRRVRVRVLDRSGHIVDVAKGTLGNSLFDEFVWNEHEQRLYALASFGGLFSWDASKQTFQFIAGRPFQFRQMRYVPRLGRVVLVGEAGLNLVRDGLIVPISTIPALPKGLYYVRDVPNFSALLLHNDKEQFLRTSDGRLHTLGLGGIEQIAELGRRSAIQLAGPKVAFDIAMTRSRTGVWQPSHVTRIPLDWSGSSMLRSFVPTLDAFVVHQPGWLDWWMSRSGFYRLTNVGLVAIGDSRQRDVKFPNNVSLP